MRVLESRAAGRAQRAGDGERHPEEHRLAPDLRARAPRARRAGRRARTAAPGTGDPARRRARHARAQRRRARPADARRARRGERRDDQPRGRRRRPASSTSPRSTAATSSATGQWLGRTVDYHCTAVGKVFLAFGRATLPEPAAARATRPRRSPIRRSSRPNSRRVRRQGFATTIDELEPGLAAIAAPVRGAGGDVVAALSISGPTLRLTPRAHPRARAGSDPRGALLSARLGYRHEGENAA